jgi:hypothetical protein
MLYSSYHDLVRISPSINPFHIGLIVPGLVFEIMFINPSRQQWMAIQEIHVTFLSNIFRERLRFHLFSKFRMSTILSLLVRLKY